MPAAAVVVEAAAVAVSAGFPGGLIAAAVVAAPTALVDDDAAAAVVGAQRISAADGVAGRPVAAAAAESVPVKCISGILTAIANRFDEHTPDTFKKPSTCT